MSASPTPRPLLLTAAIAVQACIVSAGLTACTPTVDTRPKQLAAEYLTRVVDGDIEAALKLDGTTVGAGEVLLTNAAYKKATDRISDYKILDTALTKGRADVRVRTVQHSGTKTTRLTLKKTKDSWRLLPASLGFLQIAPSPVGTAPTIAGQAIPAEKVTTVHAFPGTYELAGTSSPNITITPVTNTLTGFGSHLNVTPGASLTEAGIAAVHRGADNWLTGCATKGDAAIAPNCPSPSTPQRSGGPTAVGISLKHRAIRSAAGRPIAPGPAPSPGSPPSAAGLSTPTPCPSPSQLPPPTPTTAPPPPSP